MNNDHPAAPGSYIRPGTATYVLTADIIIRHNFIVASGDYFSLSVMGSGSFTRYNNEEKNALFY
ncbi:TPA: hypothetical protein ACIA3T_004013 [Salmonella enterica subsp. enterica serovar Saintpaul]